MEKMSIILVDGATDKELGLVGTFDPIGIPEGQQVTINAGFNSIYYSR